MLNELLRVIIGSPPDKDETFKLVLDWVVEHDLKIARILGSIPPEDRTTGQDILINFLKKEYPLDGIYQSPLFSHASRELQERYIALHSSIILYYTDNLYTC